MGGGRGKFAPRDTQDEIKRYILKFKRYTVKWLCGGRYTSLIPLRGKKRTGSFWSWLVNIYKNKLERVTQQWEVPDLGEEKIF